MGQGDTFGGNPYEAPRTNLGREPGTPGIGAAGPATVRFEIIGEAWQLLKAQWGTWVLISLVMVLCTNGINFVMALGIGIVDGTGGHPGANPNAPSPLAVLLQLLAMLVNLAVSAFLTGGILRAAIKQVRGGRIEVGDLFSAGDVVGTMMAGMILAGLAVFVGFILLIIPAFLVAGRLMLALPLIVDARLGARDAINRSWNALRGQTWASAGLNIVAGIVAALGVLACGVGLLFTLPIYQLTIAILYRDFFLGKSAWVDPRDPELI